MDILQLIEFFLMSLCTLPCNLILCSLGYIGNCALALNDKVTNLFFKFAKKFKFPRKRKKY